MVIHTHTCRICGTVFETTRVSQIYCKKLCRWKANYAPSSKKRYKHSRKELSEVAALIINSYIEKFGKSKYLSCWAVSDYGFSENIVPDGFTVDQTRRSITSEIPKFGYESIRKKKNPLFIRIDLKCENPTLEVKKCAAM